MKVKGLTFRNVTWNRVSTRGGCFCVFPVFPSRAGPHPVCPLCSLSGATASHVSPVLPLRHDYFLCAHSQRQPLPVCPLPGLDHFLHGLSDEMKQAHREQLFAVHREGLIAVSNK